MQSEGNQKVQGQFSQVPQTYGIGNKSYSAIQIMHVNQRVRARLLFKGTGQAVSDPKNAQFKQFV
jgi:hypothetical protein